VPKNAYGHASSLAMYQNLVIVQLDQGTKGENLSKLLALKADTGETAWEAPRDVPNSWPSPIVIQHDKQPLIITGGSPWVIAYSAPDGKEIWRAQRLSGDVGPSPVSANGMIYVANEFPAASAIRLGGTGDVTKTHLAFEAESGLPDCASPAVTDKYLFLLASYGMLSCYNALEGGDPVWEKEFDNNNFTSSPGLAGNHLYLFADKGKAWVVEPTDDEAKVVAESDLGEECVTSPAFQDGRLYIRGRQHLFAIGQK
jgi:outer membrane protein assembly factor BamB